MFVNESVCFSSEEEGEEEEAEAEAEVEEAEAKSVIFALSHIDSKLKNNGQTYVFDRRRRINGNHHVFSVNLFHFFFSPTPHNFFSLFLSTIHKSSLYYNNYRSVHRKHLRNFLLY